VLGLLSGGRSLCTDSTAVETLMLESRRHTLISENPARGPTRARRRGLYVQWRAGLRG
jgi:hypothetical protein